jgi:PAS domain S-box-containing protein
MAGNPRPSMNRASVSEEVTFSRTLDPSAAADPRKVLADRVEQLYSQLPLGLIATVVVGAVAAFELRQGRFVEIVIFWAALVALITAARAALLWGYRRSPNKLEEAEQWLRWLGISALANGACWGFAAAVFFPSHADEQQVFLAFLLAGVMSGGIPMYAASWPMYAAYAAGVAVPFTYVLGAYGNRLFTEIALLVPIFYAVSVGIAWRLNEVFYSAYRLRHAYGKLTADHIALNKRLEQQLGELAEARRQVEASGRKLALFAERSPVAVFELDPAGRVLSLNPAAENLFGFGINEAAGRYVAELLFVPEQREKVALDWKEFIRSRQPITALRMSSLRRDGQELVCEWSLTPLVNPEGAIISVIVQGRDVTQQLEAERMKQEFTSTLSHELRTPLTSIIGSLQLINSGVMGELDKDVVELTSIAERNGQRLLDLINDLLDIEKIESGKLSLDLQPTALDELVRESLVLNRAYAERFKVKLEMSGGLPTVQVNVDRKRAIQILTNLISNAAKFSPEGEAVQLTVDDLGAQVRVGVHDRGPGIPDSFRARIFSRFAQADMSATRQKGGTGLGLAICKRLLELMGGHIGFDGRDGGGTTFWFELPKHA